jgi:uncharacterized protein (TIGR02246 family)
MPTANDNHPVDDLLARWKTAFDAHRTDDLTALFTPDALFQGFGPEVLRGKEAVRAYYAAVPEVRVADVSVLGTFAFGAETAGGFADVVFHDPDGWRAPAHLSVVLQLTDEGWRIRQYHASKVDLGH